MRLVGGLRNRLLTPSGGAAGGGGAPTWNPTANPAFQDISFGAATATFTSQPINNASTSDVVVVFIGCDQNGPDTGVTIGGDAMTLGVRSGADGFYCAIYYRTGNIYTTPNIVVTNSGTIDQICITAGYLTGVSSTPGTGQGRSAAFTSNPHTTSAITIPATGFGLVCAFSNDTATATFNVGTKNYQTTFSSPETRSLVTGYISTAGSQTPSLNMGDIISGMCAIPFGP